MTLPYALQFARTAAESLMTDRGTVTRDSVSAKQLIDPLTGLYTSNLPPTVIYSGPCFVLERRVQNPSSRSDAGDFPYTETASLLLPAHAALVLVQDIFTIDWAPDHPQDVGLRFRITFFNPGTQIKARKCQMEAITG